MYRLNINLNDEMRRNLIELVAINRYVNSKSGAVRHAIIDSLRKHRELPKQDTNTKEFSHEINETD